MFLEINPAILYGEIATIVLVMLFAVTVFAIQCKRLGEKRRDGDRGKVV